MLLVRQCVAKENPATEEFHVSVCLAVDLGGGRGGGCGGEGGSLHRF